MSKKGFDIEGSISSLAVKSREAHASEKVHELPTKDVGPDPNQPRKHIDQAEIESLGQQIKANGQLQAIVVQRNPDPNGKPLYLIAFGERRWRACISAKIPTVQGVIRKYDDPVDLLANQVAENEDREGLTLEDTANVYLRLVSASSLAAVVERRNKKHITKKWLSMMCTIAKADGLAKRALVEKVIEVADTVYEFGQLEKEDAEIAANLFAEWQDPAKRNQQRTQIRAAREQIKQGKNPPLITESEPPKPEIAKPPVEVSPVSQVGEPAAGPTVAPVAGGAEPPAVQTQPASTPKTSVTVRVSETPTTPNPVADAVKKDGRPAADIGNSNQQLRSSDGSAPVLTCTGVDIVDSIVIVNTNNGPLRFDSSLVNLVRTLVAQ